VFSVYYYIDEAVALTNDITVQSLRR